VVKSRAIFITSEGERSERTFLPGPFPEQQIPRPQKQQEDCLIIAFRPCSGSGPEGEAAHVPAHGMR
jgi:hypothetical protein